MKAGTLSTDPSDTPRPTAASAEPARAPTARPAGAAQRVLLVDDSRSIRTLLKIYLMARNFEFVEAESGEEGIKQAEANAIDLIITDFHMEGLNGADFASQIRSSADTKLCKVPILMMTGDPNVAEVRALGQRAGISAFVRKPVSCAQLMTLVDTILPAPKKNP